MFFATVRLGAFLQESRWKFLRSVGEWLLEPLGPDFRLWRNRGLMCVVFRTSVGIFVGYVAVSPEHPLFGAADDERMEGAPVHGGVTYSGPGLPGLPTGNRLWWFGWDAAHAGDSFLGFGGKTWDMSQAVAETDALARWLVSERMFAATVPA